MKNRNVVVKSKYAILRNITGNSKLSQQARYWSEERIYKELNIYLPDYKKKTTLKPITHRYRSRLLKSADNKYNYAIKHGIDPENAEIIKFQTYKVIDLQIKYQLFFQVKYKRLSKNQKKDRIEAWRDWSSEDVYPPLMVHEARMINLKMGIDINDSYGFGIMYYVFITNKSIEAVMDQYKLDKATGMIIYPVMSKVR